MNTKIIYTILFCLGALFAAAQNLENMKGKQVKANASFQFSSAYYYNYPRNSYNMTDSVHTVQILNATPEGLLTQSYSTLLDANKDSIINRVYVYSKMIITYNDRAYCFIKYKTSEMEKLSNNKVFTLEMSGKNWNNVSYSNEIIGTIKVVLSLSNESFSQFERNEDSSNYPEINALKPQVKDADGVLNIFKLAKVVEENRGLLSKYIEE